MVCGRKEAEDTMRYAEDGTCRVERLETRHDRQLTQHFCGQPSFIVLIQCHLRLRTLNPVAGSEVSMFAAGINYGDRSSHGTSRRRRLSEVTDFREIQMPEYSLEATAFLNRVGQEPFHSPALVRLNIQRKGNAATR
jgi:hypothetical protein